MRASYRVHPIDQLTLRHARAVLLRDAHDGSDAHPFTGVLLLAAGGEPLRCCLRDAVQGEHCILFNYEPPLPAASPYQERGAVFAHAVQSECAGPDQLDGYPSAWRGRRQVLRAYDTRGFIHPASCVHDGNDPDRVIADIFAHAEVVEAHSRNVTHGCYMFAIVRGT